MKIRVRLSLIILFVAVGLTGLIAIHASADAPLTPDQLQQIQANCSPIKSTLNQLHVSDALLRVNRGQLYESMDSKLMDRFNTRLSSNGIDTTSFVTTLNDYRSSLNQFRTDYQSYEQQLSTTLNIDCTKQPAAFNDAVVSSRTKRNQVHDDVVKLNQLITDYQTAVNTLAANYVQVGGGSQ